MNLALSLTNHHTIAKFQEVRAHPVLDATDRCSKEADRSGVSAGAEI